jgi:hypothetical protein
MPFKIELKILEDNKWHGLPIKSIQGNSLVNFMVNAEAPIVAAMYEGNKKVAIVANRDEYIEMYKDKIFAISAKNLQKLVGTDTVHPLLAEVFPEANVARITVIKEEV